MIPLGWEGLKDRLEEFLGLAEVSRWIENACAFLDVDDVAFIGILWWSAIFFAKGAFIIFDPTLEV